MSVLLTPVVKGINALGQALGVGMHQKVEILFLGQPVRNSIISLNFQVVSTWRRVKGSLPGVERP
jgi:hypothetical protein